MVSADIFKRKIVTKTSHVQAIGFKLHKFPELINKLKDRYQGLETADKCDLGMQGILFTAGVSLAFTGVATGTWGTAITGVLNAGRTMWSSYNTINDNVDKSDINQAKTNGFAAATNVPMATGGLMNEGVDGLLAFISAGMASTLYSVRAHMYLVNANNRKNNYSQEINANNTEFYEKNVKNTKVTNVGICKRTWSCLKDSFSAGMQKIEDAKNSDFYNKSPKILSLRSAFNKTAYYPNMLVEKTKDIVCDSKAAKRVENISSNIADNTSKAFEFVKKHQEKIPASIMASRGGVIAYVDYVAGLSQILVGCLMMIVDKKNKSPPLKAENGRIFGKEQQMETHIS